MFESLPAIVSDCEIQIFWDGFTGMLHNRDLDYLEKFHTALEVIGSTEKMAVVDDVLKAIDGVFARRPTNKELWEILEQKKEVFSNLNSRYYSCSEDIEELAYQYLVNHPEALLDVREERRVSEFADRVYIRVVGDSARLRRLTGDTITIKIDLSKRTGCKNTEEVIRTFDAEIGELSAGKGTFKDRESILDYVQQRWGRPIEIHFLGCEVFRGSGLQAQIAYRELKMFLPLFFQGIDPDQIRLRWHA